MSKEQTKGIFCVDESGLHVCSRGTLSTAAAGDVTNELMKLASGLEPNLPMSSVVIQLIGSDGNTLSIAKDGALTTTLHRVERKK